MILKAVVLFLIVMMVLGMFGKLRAPQIGKRARGTLPKPKTCRSCGAPIPGRGPCACDADR